MQKYLDGRIKAYAHLFTELSPSIPEGERRRFCVNGVLLPGYTAECPDALKPDEAEVNKLLAFLNADELGGAAPPEPQPEEKSPQAIWERHRKQRPRSSQQKPARVR